MNDSQKQGMSMWRRMKMFFSGHEPYVRISEIPGGYKMTTRGMMESEVFSAIINGIQNYSENMLKKHASCDDPSENHGPDGRCISYSVAVIAEKKVGEMIEEIRKASLT